MMPEGHPKQNPFQSILKKILNLNPVHKDVKKKKALNTIT